MRRAWREIAVDSRERVVVPRGAHVPIRQGESIALMAMALKEADVYDRELRQRRECYSAYVEIRVGADMSIRVKRESEASQADAFEAALQHALRMYDPRLSRVKIWPLHIEIVSRGEAAVTGVQATIRVRARIEQDGWTYDGEVEHRDTVKAICLLIFQAYDAHFTEHERVGLRGMERTHQDNVNGRTDTLGTA